MRLDEACTNTFARHETFHPRWGWVKKAYDASSESSRVFHGDDATLKLGVGKNMVRSIRFWGHAFRALADTSDPSRTRIGLSVPSAIGEAIFGDSGWDPYTEDVGTLWLLHWLLFAPRCHMPVWWSAFCEFGAVEFTQQQLTDFVVDQIATVSSWSPTPQDSSIEKDVSCLLRTYAPSSDIGRRQAFDDLVDCPMRELGLLRCVDASSRRFRFVVGGKSTLPDEVVLYACADFLARTDTQGRTVTVSRLATESGSPGRVFKLSESDLVNSLESVSRDFPLLDLARPAGAVQLVFNADPVDVALESLRKFYRRRGLGRGPRNGIFAGPLADEPARFRELAE